MIRFVSMESLKKIIKEDSGCDKPNNADIFLHPIFLTSWEEKHDVDYIVLVEGKNTYLYTGVTQKIVNSIGLGQTTICYADLYQIKVNMYRYPEIFV